MKELYLNPEMDVVKFSIEDVISTSIEDPSEDNVNPACPDETHEAGSSWG